VAEGPFAQSGKSVEGGRGRVVSETGWQKVRLVVWCAVVFSRRRLRTGLAAELTRWGLCTFKRWMDGEGETRGADQVDERNSDRSSGSSRRVHVDAGLAGLLLIRFGQVLEK
jgi:hypothetical protein